MVVRVLDWIDSRVCIRTLIRICRGAAFPLEFDLFRRPRPLPADSRG